MEKDYEALRELEEELVRSLDAQRELEESGWEPPESRYERVMRRFVEALKELAEKEDGFREVIERSSDPGQGCAGVKRPRVPSSE